MNHDVKFNLQEFLAEMRREQREDHDTLTKRVDTALEKLQDHQTRLVIIETSHRNTRWLAGTMIVALLGAIVDFLFIHVPKIWR